jgi:hypothetical protein
VIPRRAWLVAGEPAAEIVRWQSSAGERRNGAVRQAVSGDLRVADAGLAAVSLEVADVVYSGRGEPMSWLAGVLDRYPGCAVAAFPAADGGCLFATRGCRLPHFLCLLDDAPASAALCAMFVHAWLAAGWPLTALNPAALAPVVAQSAVATAAQVSFALYYEGPQAAADPVSGPSSASRRRMSSLSGAPIPE